MKIEVVQKKKEDRKEYLARVMVAYLENEFELINGQAILVYDKAECDGDCLAEDIKGEWLLE